MNSSKIFKRICQVVCHVLAIWMCLYLLIRYFENEDASKIQYRKFQTNPNDLYPTLTLCINAKNGDLLIENQTTNGKKAFELFMGKGTTNTTDGYESVDFEDLMPKLYFFLKKFYAKNQHAAKIDPWYHPEIYPNGYKSFKKFQHEDLNFFTSYLDPTTICYSWNVEYSNNEILRNADLYIQLEQLQKISNGKLSPSIFSFNMQPKFKFQLQYLLQYNTLPNVIH